MPAATQKLRSSGHSKTRVKEPQHQTKWKDDQPHTPEHLSRCACTFGGFACLRTGLLFAPSDPQQPVLDSVSRGMCTDGKCSTTNAATTPVVGSVNHRHSRGSGREEPTRTSQDVEGGTRGREIRYFQWAATHGVTGTYDRAAQSITTHGTLRISGGRGEESVAGGEVRVLASSICRPRSLAVASHASITTLTTLCFLIPRHGGSSVSSSSTLSMKEQWRAALT